MADLWSIVCLNSCLCSILCCHFHLTCRTVPKATKEITPTYLAYKQFGCLLCRLYFPDKRNSWSSLSFGVRAPFETCPAVKSKYHLLFSRNSFLFRLKAVKKLCAHIINAIDERVDTAVTHSENVTAHPHVIHTWKAAGQEENKMRIIEGKIFVHPIYVMVFVY